MHLLRVNETFRDDPFFALGVVTSFERFMQGYQPEQDKAGIFRAVCQAQQVDPEQYQREANRLLQVAAERSPEDLINWVEQAAEHGGDDLQAQVQSIAHNDQFKYSRLFAIGVYSCLERADAELVKDETQLTEKLHQLCAAMNLPEVKLQRDLELYRSNLEKMAQARKTLEDIMEAERKRRQQAAEPPVKSSEENSPPQEATN